MNKLKIAYLINQYPMVSHTFIRREILALERQGFDILRISLQGWNDRLVDEEDKQEQINTRYVMQNGVIALLLAFLRTLLTNPKGFFSAFMLAIRMGRGAERPLPYHFAYLAEACRILPWLNDFGATHLHAHFGTNSAEIATLTHALSGISYSFTVHGESEVFSGGIAEKVRHASFVVAISSYGRSQLYYRSNALHWPKIKVVHCGLEPAFYNSVSIPQPVSPRLVCVGRLCIAKGQLQLIEATHRLVSKGIKFELVLAGDGIIRAEVEKLIAKYNLASHVKITGWISSSQVREEILASRALVLPSFSEGLPVVIMEAMSLRRPVLSTYISGIPELVQPGINGWLIPAGSIDDLVAAMENCLLTSQDELKKMGDAAYLRVVERHSIDTEAAKLATLIKESCASSL